MSTPGPWNVCRIYALLRYARKQWGHWDRDEDDDPLWTNGNMPDEDDAHLIAAAPELLEACEEALENDIASEGENASNMYPSLRQKLRAAIKKARGQ